MPPRSFTKLLDRRYTLGDSCRQGEKRRCRHFHSLDWTAEMLAKGYRAGSSLKELEKATHAQSAGIAASPICGVHPVGLECRWESRLATLSSGPATLHFG